MEKQGYRSALLLSALLLGALPIQASDAPANSTATAPAATESKAKEAKEERAAVPAPKPEAKAPAAKKESKPALGDGFIVQNALRVYLGRPAVISLHNARGQLLYHAESSRPMELVPLTGVNAGFLYLTLRAGQLELTKKLVYSGK